MEIKISNNIEAGFGDNELIIADGFAVVTITTAEAIQLRDFLNQLELTPDNK